MIGDENTVHSCYGTGDKAREKLWADQLGSKPSFMKAAGEASSSSNNDRGGQ